MRVIVYACVAAGLFFSGWALSNLLAWWFVASWHVDREPIIAAFFLLIPAVPCVLIASAVAAVNRKAWPRHMLILSIASLSLGTFTIILFWLIDAAPT